VIEGGNFQINRAMEDGGAIGGVKIGNISIAGTNFTNNSALHSGGAIQFI